MWFNGMLTNKNLKTTKLMDTPNNIFKLLLKLKKKPDLIISHNLIKGSTTKTEGYKRRIPIITLSNKLKLFDIKSTYESIGNFNSNNEKTTNDNLFFIVIKASLKKAKKQLK